ncbi:hypothetical protein CALVIDRAFT_561612 [Calocera viscosa TUFC12733]|uniref:Uncharacterized protein n=1 Tax=Calocera viscosa (strain TUFC12733) TaxID=1330018 RepID=A0A167PXC6_CALVF|nr:hypothetical protein CALVIDRAFT_561612 [Calocera viscosa TUFC12733]
MAPVPKSHTHRQSPEAVENDSDTEVRVQPRCTNTIYINLNDDSDADSDDDDDDDDDDEYEEEWQAARGKRCVVAMDGEHLVPEEDFLKGIEICKHLRIAKKIVTRQGEVLNWCCYKDIAGLDCKWFETSESVRTRRAAGHGVPLGKFTYEKNDRPHWKPIAGQGRMLGPPVAIDPVVLAAAQQEVQAAEKLRAELDQMQAKKDAKRAGTSTQGGTRPKASTSTRQTRSQSKKSATDNADGMAPESVKPLQQLASASAGKKKVRFPDKLEAPASLRTAKQSSKRKTVEEEEDDDEPVAPPAKKPKTILPQPKTALPPGAMRAPTTLRKKTTEKKGAPAEPIEIPTEDEDEQEKDVVQDSAANRALASLEKARFKLREVSYEDRLDFAKELFDADIYTLSFRNGARKVTIMAQKFAQVEAACRQEASKCYPDGSADLNKVLSTLRMAANYDTKLKFLRDVLEDQKIFDYLYRTTLLEFLDLEERFFHLEADNRQVEERETLWGLRAS